MVGVVVNLFGAFVVCFSGFGMVTKCLTRSSLGFFEATDQFDHPLLLLENRYFHYPRKNGLQRPNPKSIPTILQNNPKQNSLAKKNDRRPFTTRQTILNPQGTAPDVTLSQLLLSPLPSTACRAVGLAPLEVKTRRGEMILRARHSPNPPRKPNNKQGLTPCFLGVWMVMNCSTLLEMSNSA